MAENSKIEWCHNTFNPWVGCTRISPACDHCYAEGCAKRTGQSHLWAGERRRTSASNWQQPIKWDRAAAAACERYRVFCASLIDVFDNPVAGRPLASDQPDAEPRLDAADEASAEHLQDAADAGD